MTLMRLRRVAALSAAVSLFAAGCSPSLAGLYRSEDGTKTLELAEDGRFAFDLGPAAAEIAPDAGLITGRYDVTDGTVRLLEGGRPIAELRIEGDELVMEDGTVLAPV